MVTDGYANRLNGVDYNAVDERRFGAASLMPGGPTSAPFSAKAGRRVNGAGLTVSVGGSPEAWTCTAGAGVVYDSAYASQGAYRFEIPNSVSANLPARPGAGQTRTDLIVARIYDAQALGSGATEVRIERVAGTPGTPGAVPTLPALSVEVARLTVPDSGSITVTQSTERTVAAGGVLPVATTAAMDKLKTDGVAYRDLVVGNAQTNSLYRYDGTNFIQIKDAASDTDWTALNLGGGWGAFGGIYAPPAYRRVGDIVELRGVIKSGFGTGAMLNSVLPSGFQPTHSRMFVVNAGPGSAWINVHPTGQMTLEAFLPSGTNAWVSLDQIRFQRA
jgi:hypothetical protein